MVFASFPGSGISTFANSLTGTLSSSARLAAQKASKSAGSGPPAVIFSGSTSAPVPPYTAVIRFFGPIILNCAPFSSST